LKHDLFGKPASTFPDHALAPAAPALPIDRRPHEIALGDFDAVMAQDVGQPRAELGKIDFRIGECERFGAGETRGGVDRVIGRRASLRHCVGIAASGDKRSPPKPVRLLFEKDNHPGCSQRTGAFDVRL
jgi:hypothetical protein